MPRGVGGRLQALVAEANEPYAVAMAACAELAGCQVVRVQALEEVLLALARSPFDVVLMGSLARAAKDSAGALLRLRERSDVPLIVLGDSVDDAQAALEAGADRWLPKPFVPGLLVVHVRALLGDSFLTQPALAKRHDIPGLIVDRTRRTLSTDARCARFTPQEWDLLSILIDHPNRFLGAGEILQAGWHGGRHAPHELRTYVRRLRDKLERLEAPCALVSQRGLGYCLAFDRQAASGHSSDEAAVAGLPG